MDHVAYIDGIPQDFGYDRYDGPDLGPGWDVVAEIDTADSYEYDMVTVWRNTASGDLIGAWDAGCSCPTPYSGLTVSMAHTIRSVRDLDPLLARLGEQPSLTGLLDFKAHVRTALKGAS